MTRPGDIPEQIGPYRVLRPIARGGMAEVYEVEDPPTGEHFALKLLKEGGTARQRFDREYEAMTRLNHPNIVRVYNYGFHGSSPWMTMELLGGLTVQAYVKRIGRPGTPERMVEVVRVAHDIARALDHIHRRGLIHRDLKSDNVLVLPDGRVKLLDFGAAHVQDAMEQITREGEFLGTLAYASPEQFMGRGIDHRSDLYSLGVLLYRLGTGRRPFWSRDHHALAKMHVTQHPRPPRQLVSALPEELERVILWLLEKKARRRPETGAQVAEALQDIAGEPLYLPGTLDVSAAAGALVGREDQVRQVRMFLDQGKPGGVALVLGMPGSGRQTVMGMVREEAEKRAWEVWDCWGRPGQGVL
ncbi:MAG: serine/threonine-protein kinase PknK, partial [Deltaproteobacteria bacterium]|nr:serine/threonine-protein kinase PknK [Deltaproteobacteria bacterium]